MEPTITPTPTPAAPQTPAMVPAKQNTWAVPAAIVIAAIIMGGSYYLTGGKALPQGAATVPAATDQTATKIRPVDKTDHIRGNPNAPILLVEYSDYDCPFCKNFDDTMLQVMKDYGTNGKVAWVYRQLPLVQLHPNAPKISEASECVASIGGNDAFWKFTDRVYAEKTNQTFTNIARISEYAVGAGVDKVKFEDCYNNAKMKDKVAASVSEALAAGARGTPHTFVIVGDQKTTIDGAQPYPVVKQLLDSILAQLDGTAAPKPAAK